MAPQNLVSKAYALTADEDARTGDESNATLTVELSAERAFRLVPLDPAVLVLSAKDHGAAPTFSFSFSFSPTFGGVRMMSSMRPYSLAASDVRK